MGRGWDRRAIWRGISRRLHMVIDVEIDHSESS